VGAGVVLVVVVAWGGEIYRGLLAPLDSGGRKLSGPNCHLHIKEGKADRFVTFFVSDPLTAAFCNPSSFQPSFSLKPISSARTQGAMNSDVFPMMATSTVNGVVPAMGV